MNRKQKMHLIINAIMWLIIVIELIITNSIDWFNVMWLILFVSFSVMGIMSKDYFYNVIPLVVLTSLTIALYGRNKDLDTQAKAVELYKQGRYEESMDEFMKIKDAGFVDEYIDKYTVYELKGTDIKVRVEE